MRTDLAGLTYAQSTSELRSSYNNHYVAARGIVRQQTKSTMAVNNLHAAGVVCLRRLGTAYEHGNRSFPHHVYPQNANYRKSTNLQK